MDLVRHESVLLVDAGPFCRFTENGKLNEFASYLGSRAEITADVSVELARRAREDDKHADLANLGFLNFPQGDPLILSPQQEGETELIRKKNRKIGEHPGRNLGEITTIVYARDRRDHMVLMDDKEGGKLARANGLLVVTSEQLVAEMVVAGDLSEADGQPIFESVYSRGATEYQAMLTEYRS